VSSEWDGARVNRELASAIQGVLKAAGCNLRSGTIEYATPPERAEASARASRYRRLAAQMSDPAAAAGYRELAKQALEEAGIAGSHAAKAAEYEQRATQMTDPRDRSAYLELARRERETAGAR
jgi:hypothetical protein